MVDAARQGSQRSRVLLYSQRNADQHVWHCSQYEFEDVVLAVEDADLLAPPGQPQVLAAKALRFASNEARRHLGRPGNKSVAPTRVTNDYELFFGVFHFAHELDYLQKVQDWRSRCKRAVAFIVELWSPWVRPNEHHLQVLRQFDHVFVFNANVLATLRELLDVPVSYLPVATDTLLYAPHTHGPERVIDVYSYGRRSRPAHTALLELMADGRLYYTYQTIDGNFDVQGYREHRFLNAETLKRSRYTVVYDINDDEERRLRNGGEASLTSRYFETVASGAIVLGSATPVPEWDEQFGWTDCLITAPAQEDFADLLAALDAQPERLHAASVRNVSESLLRHDWVHRWDTVLKAVGMPPTTGLVERRGRLDALAAQVRASLPDGAPT